MTPEELKAIENRLEIYRKCLIGPQAYDEVADIAALLAGYKERDAEVKRLKEQINDYEVALGLVAKKAGKIVGVVNRTTQGKEPF